MSNPPARRVRITKDPHSTLWVLSCARPCRPEGPCMEFGRNDWRCFLGSGGSPEGARILAMANGYEVVEP